MIITTAMEFALHVAKASVSINRNYKQLRKQPKVFDDNNIEPEVLTVNVPNLQTIYSILFRHKFCFLRSCFLKHLGE